MPDSIAKVIDELIVTRTQYLAGKAWTRQVIVEQNRLLSERVTSLEKQVRKLFALATKHDNSTKVEEFNNLKAEVDLLREKYPNFEIFFGERKDG